MACERAGRGDWPILLCLRGGALERDHSAQGRESTGFLMGLKRSAVKHREMKLGFVCQRDRTVPHWRLDDVIYVMSSAQRKQSVTSCHYYCSWVFQSSLCKESFFLLNITLDFFFFFWSKVYIVMGFGCSHLWYGFACLSHPGGPATVLCVASEKEHAHFPNASYCGPCMVLGASHGLCQGRWAGGGEVGRRSWPYAWSMSQRFCSYMHPQRKCWRLSQKDTYENVYSHSICNSQNWKLPKYPSTGKWINCSIQFES